MSATSSTNPPREFGLRNLISDDRLKEATGRSRKQWFKALDRAGAQEWDHQRIARWLGGKHDVDSWWAQGVTIDYEYARGKRVFGKAGDGTFEISVSKSVKTTPSEIWPMIDDDEARRSWLDCEFDVRGRTPGKTLRMTASDGSRILISLWQGAAGRDGLPRTRVTVTHSRLHSQEEIPETRAYWKATLGDLGELAAKP